MLKIIWNLLYLKIADNDDYGKPTKQVLSHTLYELDIKASVQNTII